MARGRRSASTFIPAPVAAGAPPAGARPRAGEPTVSLRFRGHRPEDALAALAQEPKEVREALGQGGLNALRRLATVAPGTFFHARSVADLVATAFPGPAERAAVLLHDIGKMARPQVFAENGGADERPAPEVLRAHVVDGLALGRQLGLSRLAMEAIAEHHGTLHVSASETYPGPAPRSLFTATLMCADFIESLQTQGKLTAELACQLYLSRVQHGQFGRLLEPRVRENFAAMLGRTLAEGRAADPALAERTRQVIDSPPGADRWLPLESRRAQAVSELAGGTPMARSMNRGEGGYHSYR